MGRYDQALQRYLRALDLRRGAERQARRRHRVLRHRDHLRLPGTLRRGGQVQGRGAAGVSRPETARFWLGEILERVGQQPQPRRPDGRRRRSARRSDELARDLKNPNLIAQTLTFQADRLYYAGDVKGASAWPNRPRSRRRRRPIAAWRCWRRPASRSRLRRPADSRARRAAGDARAGRRRGPQSLAVECSIQRAETLMKLGDRPPAAGSRARPGESRDAGLPPVAGARPTTCGRAAARGERSRRAPRLRLGAAAAGRDQGEDGNQDVLKRSDLAPSTPTPSAGRSRLGEGDSFCLLPSYGPSAVAPAMVLFDGTCAFCEGSVKFIARRDPRGYFRFGASQSASGAPPLADTASPARRPGAWSYRRWTGVFAIDREPANRSAASVSLVARREPPDRAAPIRDPVYRGVAAVDTGWRARPTLVRSRRRRSANG